MTKEESEKGSDSVEKSIDSFKSLCISLFVVLFIIVIFAFMVIDKLLSKITKIDAYLARLAELNFTIVLMVQSINDSSDQMNRNSKKYSRVS